MKRNYKKLDKAVLRRLRAAYDNATLAERVSGLDWYRKANSYATDLARRYGYSLAQVTAVIAALSPGAAWEVNMEQAEVLLDHVRQRLKVPTLGVYGRKNVEKAIAALALEDPLVLFSGTTGPKTRAFYLAILDAVDCVHDAASKVVIDRHAASAALNGRGARGGSSVDVIKPALYRWLARHYTKLALEIGIDVWQLQGIVWNSWRKTVPGTEYKLF